MERECSLGEVPAYGRRVPLINNEGGVLTRYSSYRVVTTPVLTHLIVLVLNVLLGETVLPIYIETELVPIGK